MSISVGSISNVPMFEVIGYQLAEIHLQQMAWISKWENITSMFCTLKKKSTTVTTKEMRTNT